MEPRDLIDALRVEGDRVGTPCSRAWRSARWPAYIHQDSAGLLRHHNRGLTPDR